MDKDEARLLALTFVTNLSRNMWINLFPLYLDGIGFGVFEVSVLSSLLLTLPLLSSGITGYLADRYGVRRVLFASLTGQALFLIPLITLKSLLAITASVVGLGIAMSLFSQACILAIARLAPSAKRGMAYGAYYFSTQLAFMGGAFVSGVVVAYLGYPWLFTISSLMTLAGLPLVSSLDLPPEALKDDLASLWNRILNFDKIRRLIYTVALHDFSAFIPGPFLPLFAKYVIGLSDAEVGFLYGARGLGTMLFQLISGKLADVLGPVKALAAHIACVSLSLFLYSLSRDYLTALAVMVFQGVIITLDMPARRSLIAAYAPKGRVGSTSGLADMITGAATLPSPLIGGLLWSNLAPQSVFLVASLLNLFSLIPLKGADGSLKRAVAGLVNGVKVR